MLYSKNILNIILGFCFLAISQTPLFSTHIVGGELTYRCLGNEEYEVLLVVRRDCLNGAEDAQLDDPATIGIYDIFGGLQIGLGELGRINADIESRTIISNEFNDCSFGEVTGICVEEAIYRDTIKLPYNKIGYCLAYQRCCRNSIIANIEDPLLTGTTYRAKLTAETLLSCNSQPRFKEWPDINICLGEEIDFDHSAVDIDGDELVYKICTPTAGASIDNPHPAVPIPPYDPIIWANGFGTNSIFNSDDDLEINENNGRLTGIPDKVGTYLVGICVEEYRNGVLLSTTQRDFEFNVFPCTDPITVDYEIRGEGCDGDNTISIVNNTVGADEFTWYFDFPNTDPNFISNTSSPTFTYPAPGVYTVRLEATRDLDGCTVVREFQVRVGLVEISAEFNAIALDCEDGQVTVLFTDNTVGGEGYTPSWIIDGQSYSESELTLSFDEGAIIEVFYSLSDNNGCESSQSTSINLTEFIKEPLIEVELIDCNEEGNLFRITELSGSEASWIIKDGDNPEATISGNPAEFLITSDRFEITLNSSNSCYTDVFQAEYRVDDYVNPDFEVRVLSCTPSGNFFSFMNPTDDNATWTIETSSGTETFNGDNFSTFVPSGSFSITLDLDNPCINPVTKTLNTEDFETADFETILVACTDEGFIFNFENPSGTDAEWTISDSRGTTILTGHKVTALINPKEFTVTMDLQNGCSDPITKNLNTDDFANPDFEVILVSCTELGFLYEFRNEGGISSEWTIMDTQGTIMLAGNVIQHETPDEMFMVTLSDDQLCFEMIKKNIFADDYLPDLRLTVDEGVDCFDPNGQDISVVPSITNNNFGVPTYSWNYSLNGGGLLTSNAEVLTIMAQAGDQLFAELTLTFPNGCEVTESINVTLGNNVVDGELDINPDKTLECLNPDGELITFLSELTNIGSPIDSYEWTYVDSLQTLTGNESTFPVDVIPDVKFTITLKVTLEDGCMLIASEMYTATPLPRWTVEEDIDCVSIDSTVITLTATELSEIEIESYQWYINNVEAGNGNQITFSLTEDDVTIRLEVLFENGCTDVFEKTYEVDDFRPTIDYKVDLLECRDSTGIFSFDFCGFVPECLSIVKITWTINGQEICGDTVTVELPLIKGNFITVDVSVEYSNGDILESDPLLNTIEPWAFLETYDIEIEDKGSSFCLDSLNLHVLDPDSNLVYSWYADPNCIRLLGEGDSLVTGDAGLMEGDSVIYVISGVNENCEYGIGRYTLEDQFIQLAYDSLITLCPGDTATVVVENLIPDHILTYEWKDGSDLITSGEMDSVIIVVPDDQMDDFILVFCTENQFGCTRSDTIRFELDEAEDINPFSWEPDSCGSFTIHFDAEDNELGDGLLWTFGDGNMSMEEDPTHTYEMEGTYIVTLSSKSEFCKGEPYRDTITVPVMPMIEIIGGDTIFYKLKPVELEAETDVSPDMVSWCLEDGTVIGVGNPIEYTPEQDTVIVIAKATDEFGCTDSDSTILIFQPEFPEIDIIGDSLVCPEDPFMLEVAFDGDPNNFTFDWSPEACILEGNGTTKITATASEDKTFSVVITNNTTGTDSTITFFVEVALPEVNIIPDNGHPDQFGEPMVCQGSEILLEVDPFDPDCEYSWSTGETGPEITVSPEVNTTYSVTCVNSLGCINSDTIDIEVIEPQCNEDDVFIPNAFSPNGDNVNDFLLVRSKFIREMEFFVVDRWGEEVWRTNSQSQGWDGTFKGETLAPDVYAFCLIVTCVNGVEYKHTGNVSLLK